MASYYRRLKIGFQYNIEKTILNNRRWKTSRLHRTTLTIIITLFVVYFMFFGAFRPRKILLHSPRNSSFLKMRHFRIHEPCEPWTYSKCLSEKHLYYFGFIEKELEETLKIDKGRGCKVPDLYAFSSEVLPFIQEEFNKVDCSNKVEWVKCYEDRCTPNLYLFGPTVENLECVYNDIIYDGDEGAYLGNDITLRRQHTYVLKNSDHVKIRCEMKNHDPQLKEKSSWEGYGVGFRVLEPLNISQVNRQRINVLILAFEKASKNGFIRKMPETFKLLEETLQATVLNGYNIAGDGTPAAIIPVLTGMTEWELPEARKAVKGSKNLEPNLFIFSKISEYGYRTAFFEDMPWEGVFKKRFNGFFTQPTDHYTRAVFMHESDNGQKWIDKDRRLCFGGTPQYEVTLNLTYQFLRLGGLRFAFTFIGSTSYDDFNEIQNADSATKHLLFSLYARGELEQTLLIVMGDQGPSRDKIRDSYHGQIEERLPFMAIRLPEKMRVTRNETFSQLKQNADVLTTPLDIYATVLDALNLRHHWNPYKVKGADKRRGMSLLQPIPKTRSCSEAGIEAHWCTCLRWNYVSTLSPIYERVAQAVVKAINDYTSLLRSDCALRELVSIEWVKKQKVHTVGSYNKQLYQAKITTNPGGAKYEATVTQDLANDVLSVNTRHISRINSYGDEAICLLSEYPHLNAFCYCNELQRVQSDVPNGFYPVDFMPKEPLLKSKKSHLNDPGNFFLN